MTERQSPLISPSFFTFGALTVLLFALASACGGGGTSEPACRTEAATEAVTPNPMASFTMGVGSYEGTGTPQCIRGVGFQPVLVIIKGDVGEPTVWRSSSMEGDFTTDFVSAQAPFEDGITSLDPDAFSVGEDARVNAEGVGYDYVAFADSPDIKAGSYTGDDMDDRSISGVGFRPALVFLRVTEGRSAVWRPESFPEGMSDAFSHAGDVGNLIQGFEADGFQVGSDAFVNLAGFIYHYIAFPEVPGHLTTGTYTGDGSNNREVADVGFQPDYVWVKRASEEGEPEDEPVHRPSSLAGDATLSFGNITNASDQITDLLPDGFEVGSEPAVNSEGETYYYVAWKASSGP